MMQSNGTMLVAEQLIPINVTPDKESISDVMINWCSASKREPVSQMANLRIRIRIGDIKSTLIYTLRLQEEDGKRKPMMVMSMA